jgi:hypothetical protein
MVKFRIMVQKHQIDWEILERISDHLSYDQAEFLVMGHDEKGNVYTGSLITSIEDPCIDPDRISNVSKSLVKNRFIYPREEEKIFII